MKNLFSIDHSSIIEPLTVQEAFTQTRMNFDVKGWEYRDEARLAAAFFGRLCEKAQVKPILVFCTPFNRVLAECIARAANIANCSFVDCISSQSALDEQCRAAFTVNGIYTLPAALGRGFDMKFSTDAHVFVLDLDYKLTCDDIK